MNPILSVSLLAGALTFEHKTGLRLLLSAPLCGGFLTGIILGAPTEGLLAGLMLQVLFLGSVGLRGRRAPDIQASGVLAASLYIMICKRMAGDASVEGMVLFWALLYTLAAARVQSIFYRWWERVLASPIGKGLDYAKRGSGAQAAAIHLALSSMHFVFGFALVLLFLPAGLMIIGFLSQSLEALSAGSIWVLPLMIPLIGAGSLLKLYLDRAHLFWFGAGFLLTAVFFIFGGQG
jgi:PTS system mannose-specific IIC component